MSDRVVGNRLSLAQAPCINKYLRAFASALLMLVFAAGCSSSPTMFGVRLTDSGRLLMDGPPARMTATAITQDRAEEVPLLYNFAIGAGQIPGPNSTIPFPAPDLPSQQLALLQVADWRAVTLVGEGYIDKQCDQFIAALNDLERSKKTTLANLNTIQAATVGIMGLAIAAQKTIGIVGIAFGLAASLFDTPPRLCFTNCRRRGCQVLSRLSNSIYAPTKIRGSHRYRIKVGRGKVERVSALLRAGNHRSEYN